MTKENLVQIEELEDSIRNSAKWQATCYATGVEDTTCSDASFSSPLVFLSLQGEAGKVADLTQDQIDAYWKNFYTNILPSSTALQALYTKLELIEEQGGRIQYMRSILQFGFPIEVDGKRYKDLLDGKQEQKDYVGKYQTELYEELEK